MAPEAAEVIDETTEEATEEASGASLDDIDAYLENLLEERAFDEQISGREVLEGWEQHKQAQAEAAALNASPPVIEPERATDLEAYAADLLLAKEAIESKMGNERYASGNLPRQLAQVDGELALLQEVESHPLFQMPQAEFEKALRQAEKDFGEADERARTSKSPWMADVARAEAAAASKRLAELRAFGGWARTGSPGLRQRIADGARQARHRAEYRAERERLKAEAEIRAQEKAEAKARVERDYELAGLEMPKPKRVQPRPDPFAGTEALTRA